MDYNPTMAVPLYLPRQLFYALLIFILYLSSFYLPDFFYTATEIISIVAAAATFLFAWNSRFIMKNNYFLLIGISSLAIAFINFTHILFDQFSSQHWFNSRLMLAVTLLIAPYFLTHKLRLIPAIFFYTVITLFLLFDSLFTGYIPLILTTLVPFSPFHLTSEIIICILFLISILRLNSYRSKFYKPVGLFIQLALVFGIFTGLIVTLENTLPLPIYYLAFISRLMVYYYIYKAVVEIGLSRPYQLMFLELEKLNQRKDEFISIASHEIKNPLTNIKLYSQLLSRTLKNKVDPKTQKMITQIDRQVEKINHLIDDMLDASRMETGKFSLSLSSFRLDRLLKRIITDKRLSHPNYKFIISSLHSVTIVGDEHRIGQVIENLLSNSIKYSPSSFKIRVSLTSSSGYATITIQDYGSGISKTHLPYIFDKYYRVTDDSSQPMGLGLGLYLVKEIITRHKGQIDCVSELNKGSTFYVTLPVANPSVKNT